MCDIYLGYVARIHGPWHTHECAMQIWMSHGKPMNETRHTYLHGNLAPHVLADLHMWHDSFICVTGLIHMCDTTHLHVWRDPPPCLGGSACVIWLIHMCDMTYSYVWQASSVTPPTPPPCLCGCAAEREKGERERKRLWERARAQGRARVCVCGCVHACKCVCVCVWEREREREWEPNRSRGARALLQKRRAICSDSPSIHCNTLHHTATYCHILQRTLKHNETHRLAIPSILCNTKSMMGSNRHKSAHWWPQIHIYLRIDGLESMYIRYRVAKTHRMP